MESMGFGLPRPWEIKIPPVIRYLERKYVEEFFRTGRLMLTTYRRCQDHECDVRRDSGEGKSQFSLKLESLGMGGGGLQTVGWQSYLLCASMNESQKLAKHFKVDSYFKIKDVIRFLDAISKWIPGCGSGKLGACIYRDENALAKPLQFKSIPPGQGLPTNSAKPMFSPVEFEMSDEPYFIKSDTFAIEAEFRFIWSVPYDIEGPIFIECPEAIQYCEPDIPVSDAYEKPRNSGDVRSSILMTSNCE